MSIKSDLFSEVIYGSRVGDRFYVYVQDNDAPGSDGDMISWGWVDACTYTGDITGGNLLVYE